MRPARYFSIIQLSNSRGFEAPLKCLKINCAVFSFAICYNMKQQESPFWGNKAYNPYNLSLLYKLDFSLACTYANPRYILERRRV